MKQEEPTKAPSLQVFQGKTFPPITTATPDKVEGFLSHLGGEGEESDTKKTEE